MNPNYFHVQVDASSPIAQVKFQQNVGFQATSVKVGNYSCYWLYFPDANAFVPPFYIDYTLILKHTTDIQNYWLINPSDTTASVAQTWTSPSYFFNLEFSDDPRITFAQGIAVNANNINIIVPPTSVNILNGAFDAIKSTLIQLNPLVPTAIPTAAYVGRKALMIQALPSNTGTVYIGDSNVTADEVSPTGGVQLWAGMSYPIDVNDNGVVWAIAAIASQKIIVQEGKAN